MTNPIVFTYFQPVCAEFMRPILSENKVKKKTLTKKAIGVGMLVEEKSLFPIIHLTWS